MPLAPGRYYCTKCKREVTLNLPSMAYCIPCDRKMKPVKPDSPKQPELFKR
ncbi:hypothetical protein [Aquisalimonas sp.]|uniref:hypothetical protein n=1 Tax=Aquisalimonas sp. TaxID=1872621 RepID=UPI0025BB7C9D|nr:hypothetical protein [Aquisalimonas sp.]